MKIFVFIILLVLLSCSETEEESREEPIKNKQTMVDENSVATDSIDSILEQNILDGKGLHETMESIGIVGAHALELINLLRFEADISILRTSHKIRAKWLKDSTQVEFFEFIPNEIETYRLEWQPDSNKYFITHDVKPVDRKYRLIEGTLKSGSNVDQILYSNDVPGYLVNTISGVLACKMSLRTQAQPGDKFKFLLEEDFYKGARVQGRVLYTQYQGRVTGFHEAFYYSDPSDSKSSFNAHYTTEGEALVADGLRYPVDRIHISSNYGMRRHPVTGRRRMHAGIDYAARTGTPVYAVATGQVVISSYDKYSGNKVAIRHKDKSTSYYLHLSKRLVRKGQSVRPRQIIGRVGSTGRVTGPHLHFGFKRPNGKWMNPSSKRMIATPKLKGDRLASLKEQVKSIKEIKDSAVIEQAMHPLPNWPEGVKFLWFDEEPSTNQESDES